MEERRIISFSLWGSAPMYLRGAVLNAQLAKTVYPGWKCRFYVGKDVEESVRADLVSLGSELVEVDDPPSVGYSWRFMVADDPNVDRFIVRDCDSRLSVREAAAVEDWISRKTTFHMMKDHPWHCGVPVCGGMWGMRHVPWFKMKEKMKSFFDANRKTGKNSDQEFLKTVIWPQFFERGDYTFHVDPEIFFSWRVCCIPFPRPRACSEFVGEVFDERGRPNSEHREALEKHLKRGSTYPR